MHTLPTGATPVPKGENGQRKIRGWDFYYGGLENENTKYNVRSGSRPENLFPKDRMGSLDGELLSKMGLTTERMVLGDALSFYQLLLPICNPTRSGIPGDARKPFFSKVEEFTNSYTYSIGLRGLYRHRFKPIELHELVNFDGVVVKDGVRGGSVGGMYRRWLDGSDYDEVIAESINHSRWLQIKSTIKLNNNATSPKRGDPGYDPE